MGCLRVGRSPFGGKPPCSRGSPALSSTGADTEPHTKRQTYTGAHRRRTCGRVLGGTGRVCGSVWLWGGREGRYVGRWGGGEVEREGGRPSIACKTHLRIVWARASQLSFVPELRGVALDGETLRLRLRPFFAGHNPATSRVGGSGTLLRDGRAQTDLGREGGRGSGLDW